MTDAKALYDSYQREALGNNLTDKRTGLEIRVMKERLQGLGGRLRWMSSERQFADGLTKFGTRQLLADRLRYGKVKYTWDPDYVASKKKGWEERQQSRQEFARSSKGKQDPVRGVDEEKMSATDAEGIAACAYEYFMSGYGGVIEYKDMASVALSLNEYDPVHVNAMVPEEHFVTDDEKTANLKYDKLAGWRLAFVVFAAMINPVETASPFDRVDQCLKADEPEEV